MIGWELPPFYAGGVGMVCYDLLKVFSKKNIKINYLMPFTPKDFNSQFKDYIIDANQESSIQAENIQITNVETLIRPYETYETYNSQYIKKFIQKSFENSKALYGANLYSEVDLFAKRAYDIAEQINCDVIHAHDWMTIPAAIAIAHKKNKPFVLHIHNTVYDRSLNEKYSTIERDIELQGFTHATKIIAISHYVKNMLINKYGINPNKIIVIHNAMPTLIEEQKAKMNLNKHKNKLKYHKVVLYTGRLTFQKGIDKFIHAAKKITQIKDDVLFIVAGGGHLFEELIELANNLGIGDKVLFTGTYNLYQANILYLNADCFVMPSVSEPFGLVPFEAISHYVPTIISKTSGCAEVLPNCLQIDHFDINTLADYVINILEHDCLSSEMAKNSFNDMQKLSWEDNVDKLIKLYEEISN